MCGVTALFDPQRRIGARDIGAMTDTLRHRGPDDEGYLVFDGEAAVALTGPDTVATRDGRGGGPAAREDHTGPVLAALGHRRLAIIDPGPAGHQPMPDTDRRVWLSFNGEIYNYLELRAELQAAGHVFQTGSDSEVLLGAWREWGPDCLHRFNGMFAFIILDLERDVLFAARDRFAVKPLYFWRGPWDYLALASEIKAFTVLPGWRAALDPRLTYDFLNWGLSDHTAGTLFAGVGQLRGGERLLLSLDRPVPASLPVERWYEPPSVEVGESFQEGARRFAELFQDSVRLRLRADVPVATALSGGLDSSSVACVMADLLRGEGVSGSQHSFSACSEDARFDERPFIDAVIEATGIANHRCFPDPDILFDELARITWHQDEPFGSTSIFAEWSVFDLVRRHGIKVTLDGHGADELLCGYHVFFGALLSELLRAGRVGRVLAEARALWREHGYGPAYIASIASDSVLPDSLRGILRSLAGRTTAAPDWLAPDIVAAGQGDPFDASGGRGRTVTGLNRSQLLHSSLPMQLHWADRDSMAHSVESREPFLDHRLVEFLLCCPSDWKIGAGWTKAVLRQGLARQLPQKVARRRDKMGFVTPEEVWARNTHASAFRRRVERALEDSGGILTAAAGRKAFDMIEGLRPYNPVVWRIISFGAWMETFSVERQSGRK